MENYSCERHRRTRNERNLLLDDDSSIIINDCSNCKKVSRIHTPTLFNIEDVNWQDGNVLTNSVFLTTNNTESRLSLNSGDSVDAPLLLNVSSPLLISTYFIVQ